MQDYDATLKNFLCRLTPRVFAGARRVDMPGETSDGRLTHIELQSTNDEDMAARMADYALAIYWNYRKLPEQLVLYVGHAPLRMEGRFAGFECRVVDIRQFDGSGLLESENLEDNVIGILLHLADEREALRRILWRINRAEPVERDRALTGLLVLARLRRLSPLLEEETAKMPIFIDWKRMKS